LKRVIYIEGCSIVHIYFLIYSQAQELEEALDVDDLEADKRPEDLMLSYVSDEKG
jgi:hypothetical protein